MTSNTQAKTSGTAQLSSHLEIASEQLRETGAAALEWVTKYLERVESLPVLSQVKPGEILASLPQHPPLKSEPLEDILADLDSKILPGVTHWQSPHFHAYFPGN